MNKGFTLSELLIVVLIIGILLGAINFALKSRIDATKDFANKRDLEYIQTVIDQGRAIGLTNTELEKTVLDTLKELSLTETNNNIESLKVELCGTKELDTALDFLLSSAEGKGVENCTKEETSL